jgi:hypothetical protein
MRNNYRINVCDICKKPILDRSEYLIIKRYRTIKDKRYYTREQIIGKPLHIHDKCWEELIGFHDEDQDIFK